MKVNYILILISILTIHLNAQSKLLVPIQIDGKWGFVNNDLDFVIPTDYDSVSLFIRNVALVKQENLYGVIDRKGNTILESKYQRIKIGPVGNFLLAQRKKKKIYFDSEGHKMKESPENMIYCGTGICHAHSSNPEKYSIEKKDNYALKFLSPYSDESTGEILYKQDNTDFIFESVIPFYYNSFIVGKDNKIGIWIPEDLYVKIEFKYDEILINSNTFCSSLHRFRVDNRWGLMDHFGREIIAPIYYSIHEERREISTELCLVEYKKGVYGYIDRTGKEYFIRNLK